MDYWKQEAADWRRIAEQNTAKLDDLRDAARAVLSTVERPAIGGIGCTDPGAARAALAKLESRL